MANAAQEQGKPSSTLMAGLALALAFLFNVLGRGIGDTYMVFLLPLNAEFGWSRSELSSVYSIYMLSTGLSAPFVGLLFDRWGPRAVYATGLACLGAAYVLAGNLNQLWQFQLCVGIAGGVGVSALGMVPAAGLISRWYRGNTGTAIGIAYSGVGCGTLLIVPLAQYLNESVGWRNAYYFLGAGLLVILPIILFLPWRRLRAGACPETAADKNAPSAQRRDKPPQASPLVGALKTRAFWELAQVFGFTGLAMYVILVQTVAFLIEIGFAPLQAAGAFGIAGMLSVVGVSASGALADRIGYRRTVTASFVSTFIGLLFLLSMTYQSSAWLLFGYVAMFGIAQGARGPIVSSLCAKIFPGRGLGTIYGTIYACMSIGAALGSLASGVLHDLTDGYRASFYFSMICLMLAIAPFWTSATLKRFGRA